MSVVLVLSPLTAVDDACLFGDADPISMAHVLLIGTFVDLSIGVNQCALSMLESL